MSARVLFMAGRMRWLRPVWDVARDYRAHVCRCVEDWDCHLPRWAYLEEWDLIITAGWRHLVPDEVLERTPLGVVGFHSAKLPEYPGRAPVPHAILRGDTVTENTMLFLASEPDAGDIIDRRQVPVTTPEEMNRRMGETAAEMIAQHLPALLIGRANREPQDLSKRGPLTDSGAWKRLPQPDWIEAFG